METHKIRQSPALPEPRLLERPWKIEPLLSLPQTELRAWFDNASAGNNIGENSILMRFGLGKKTWEFRMSPKTLRLPDGQSIMVEGWTSDLKGELLKKPKDVVAAVIASSIPNRHVPIVGVGDPDELVRQLVSNQFDMIAELGVERYGFFEQALGGLRHSSRESGVVMTSFLDRIISHPSFGNVPDVMMNVYSDSGGGDIHCEYHTHPGKDNTMPSEGDIALMRGAGQSSILIGARDSEDSFKFAEWRLKKTAEGKVAAAGGFSGRPLEWMRGDRLQAYVADVFDRREFILKDGGGKMSIQETPV
jgi:hypothetical protein